MLTYFDETIPEMQSIRFLNRNLKLISTLKVKTHFDLEEIQNLLIIHHKLTEQGGPLNYRKFREVAHRVFDISGVELYDKIYNWCDPHRITHVSLENWVLALSVLLRGSLQEKIDFCWKVYDLYGTGYITRELMFQYLKSSIIKTSAGEDSNEVVKDLVDVVLKKMDVDRDGKISYDDYQASVFKNPMMLEALGSALPPRPFALGFLTTFTPKYVHSLILVEYPQNKILSRPLREHYLVMVRSLHTLKIPNIDEPKSIDRVFHVNLIKRTSQNEEYAIVEK